MNQLYKGKAKNILILLTVLMLWIITLYGNATSYTQPYFHINLTTDTFPFPKNTDIKKDTTPTSNRIFNTGYKKDTVPVTDTFSFKISSSGLDAPVTYHADDSMVLDVPTKKIILYGKETKVKYTDNELVAPHIEFDQRTNLVSAYLTKDSLGEVISYPTFLQGDLKTISDSIRFNMKTGKGLTKGTYTKQGEMYVYGEKIKKVDTAVFYALNGRFTTCNLDTPHFAFVSKKIKFINKKMAFTGPVHPEVEGVPLPIVFPFGIYPLTQGRHSGFLAPTFTANEQLGLALEGLGYYKILSDNWDIVARGTIYSYGGWTANASPRYFKRYHYQGSIGLDVQHFRDIDKAGQRSFNVRWSHSADTKSRPGVTFSANVNAGSSKFNEQVPNSPQRNFTNQLNSSITYAKVWKDKPYNISISANHNQNTTLRLVNLNLPDIAFNVNTINPFRRKEAIGNLKWYENIGIALNSNAKSLTSFYDTASSAFAQARDNFQWGASHSVPITLSLPQVGAFQFSPSISYQERWYQQQFIKQWNDNTNKIDTLIKKGFYSAREMSFGMSATTRIFGMIGFNKNSKVQAIRHEIRPSMSVSYRPDMNKKNYYNTRVNLQNDSSRFSLYERSIFGSFGEGKFGGLSFGLDNNIQMKVRNKKDTTEGAIKKISLIDGLSINGSYNFLRDSFRLDPLSLSFRSNILDKINITGNATLDPYLTNSNGNRIDKLIWTEKPFSLGTLTGGNIALQSSFNGGDKSKQGITQQNQQVQNPSLDPYQQEAAYIKNNPGEFTDFSIPWSINFSYALSFQRLRKQDLSGFETSFSQNVNWNGTLSLTPKWQIGLNGFYNITEKELGTISVFLSREMHCWQMSINLSPVGRYRFFNISISPKSNLLRDLKINRTRYFYDL
jgi:LPS-assembly protein